LKLLHTIATAGIMGGGAAIVILAMLAAAATGPDGAPTAGFSVLANGMAKIALWVIAPSMLVVIVTGLLAMLITPVFQDAGWVWAKAAMGILVFQAGLHVLGPLQSHALGGAAEPAPAAGAATAAMLSATANTMWVLLAVSVANIVLAIWRPKFFRPPK
jgi:uncharacterized membrane protein